MVSLCSEPPAVRALTDPLLTRPDGGAYDKEKAAIDEANPTSFGDTLYGITVGSEGMYRGTYNAEELVAWIGDMQKSYPDASIGTADSWNSWANGSMDSIIPSVDIAYGLSLRDYAHD